MKERWVKVGSAPDETNALMMAGVLRGADIPVLIQRGAGFDAPEFLAAGPRNILVPSDFFEDAKELLDTLPARVLGFLEELEKVGEVAGIQSGLLEDVMPSLVDRFRILHKALDGGDAPRRDAPGRDAPPARLYKGSMRCEPELFYRTRYERAWTS